MNSPTNSLPPDKAPEPLPAQEDSQAIELIKRAVAARATEVHIEPVGGDRVIRFRIDGKLEHHCYLDGGLSDAVMAQLQHLAAIPPGQPERARGGRLQLPQSLADVQVHLTVTPGAEGEAIVLGIRTRESLLRPLEALGMSAAALDCVEQMIARDSGLVLVAGPEESGKTTTVYSLLRALAGRGKKVATLEDPIAFELPEFHQTEVGAGGASTLAGGLASLLEGDAEVILVAELRDAEAAEFAVRAASSGKFVFTTMPGGDVASALAHLCELYPDLGATAGPASSVGAHGWISQPWHPAPETSGSSLPSDLATPEKGAQTVPLVGVIAQRLLRRLCQQCCERLPAGLSVRQMFQDCGVEPPLDICRPMGCTRCRGTGYRDRLAVFEVAGPDHPAFAALAAGASEAKLRSMIHAGGTGTLDSEALGRLREGEASVEEVKALLAELPPTIPTLVRRELGETELGAQQARTESLPTPPAEKAGWHVVIFATPDDPFALRDLFVERFGMHPTDAMIRAHSAPGILPDQLSDDEAAHWVQAIGELGLHSEAVPAAEVPDFGHGEAVHHARLLEAGLEIIEIHGQEEQVVPWPDVALLSVGQVPQEVSRRYVMPTTTLTAARRTLPPPVDVPLPSGPELWVVGTNPLRPFRIDHKRLNYEYLGERKTDSATRNFRVFIEELVRHAPGAYLTPATRAYLEHGSLRHYEFDSPAELRRYTVFHVMLWQRLRQQQDLQTPSVEGQQ